VGCYAGTLSKTHAEFGQRHSELKDHFVDRMICYTSSLTIVSFCNIYFDRVLLQLMGTDIVNTLFKYRVSFKNLTLMILTFELLMKRCAKLDLLFVNIQCAAACSLGKVNFKV